MGKMSCMLAANNRKATKVNWSVEDLLGGYELLGSRIMSTFDLITLSNEGLKKASLDTLLGFLGITKKPFAE